MIKENITMIKNTKLLRLIGFIPGRFDGFDDDRHYRINRDKIPFSSVHRTFNDYIKDLDKLSELDLYKELIPDDLFIRLRTTALEINLVDE